MMKLWWSYDEAMNIHLPAMWIGRESSVPALIHGQVADAYVKLIVAPFADNLVNSARHKGELTVTCGSLVSLYELY